MHHSSSFTIRQVLKRHLATDPVLSARPLRVLDVGGADYNGSYRLLFERIGAQYTAVDISEGPGVDMVMSSTDRIDLESGSYDIVVSGQTFEHSWNFWELFAEMVRLCVPDGLILVIAPSGGPEHRYPVDCYRFYPDAFAALADAHSMELAESFQSPFGPFFDLAGVFRPTARADGGSGFVNREMWFALDDPVQNDSPDELDPEVEVRAGSMPTGDFLSMMHNMLAPRNYLEVGVWRGNSLVRATCNAVGVDPYPDVRQSLSDNHRVVEMTGEDFFVNEDVGELVAPLDLVFIDGMHLIEYALTDFMWVEKYAHAATVVVIDDIFPNHPTQAERIRQSQAWTGDVWKIVDLLRLGRQDLLVLTVDTNPTGCAVVIGLDPESTDYWSNFDLWIDAQISDREPGERVLNRDRALAPDDPLIERVIGRVREARDNGQSPNVEEMKRLVTSAFPRMLAGQPGLERSK